MVALTLAAPRVQGPMPPPFHAWTQPDGSAWTEFHRVEGGYLLRFPRLADFAIAADGASVTCYPGPHVPEDTVQHLYQYQVLPLALSQQGKLVVHASAVEVDAGAVAFVATTGSGKSTLAAHFAVNGFRFLTDDGLVLDPTSRHHVARPSHPSIRLWEDSTMALMSADAIAAPTLAYTSKSRFLASDQLPYCPDPLPLQRVYFLQERDAPQIAFRPLGAQEAMVEWMRHSFVLDVEEKPRLASHFARVGRLAREPIHFTLEFPRRFTALPQVRCAIVAHARRLEPEGPEHRHCAQSMRIATAIARGDVGR
jgi:hypothetical protein